MQTIMQDLQLHLDCHNLCAHMWKTQLKIQLAIPIEYSPENPSIDFCAEYECISLDFAAVLIHSAPNSNASHWISQHCCEINFGSRVKLFWVRTNLFASQSELINGLWCAAQMSSRILLHFCFVWCFSYATKMAALTIWTMRWSHQCDCSQNVVTPAEKMVAVWSSELITEF